jgi:hypothetical protein
MQPRKHAVARHAGPIVDRLFLGGCIGAYLMLIVSVFAALKFVV